MTEVHFITLDGVLRDISHVDQVPRAGDFLTWSTTSGERFVVTSVTWDFGRRVEHTPVATVEMRLEQ